MKSFAGRSEVQETRSVQVGKDEEDDIHRQVKDT